MRVQRGDVFQVSQDLSGVEPDRAADLGYRQGGCVGCGARVVLHPLSIRLRERAWKSRRKLLPIVCDVCLPAAPTTPPRIEGRP